MKNKNIQFLFKNIFILHYNIVSRYFRVGFLRSSREFLAIFSIFSRNSWSVWSQLFLKPTSVASLWLPHSLVLEIKVGLIREHPLMMSDNFWPPNPPWCPIFTIMVFASIYLINPRTNPWNFGEKILRSGSFEKTQFFWVGHLGFFASSAFKSVNIYRVE